MATGNGSNDISKYGIKIGDSCWWLLCVDGWWKQKLWKFCSVACILSMDHVCSIWKIKYGEQKLPQFEVPAHMITHTVLWFVTEECHTAWLMELFVLTSEVRTNWHWGILCLLVPVRSLVMSGIPHSSSLALFPRRLELKSRICNYPYWMLKLNLYISTHEILKKVRLVVIQR